MKESEILEWVKREFSPLVIATPDKTIMQMYDNAVRYWNTHSAFKVIQMVNYSFGEKVVEINTDIKQVVEVLPGNQSDFIFNDYPLWSLLGITILDNVTQDLILMGESFKAYRKYVSTDFKWTFVPSNDPAVKGKLYVVNSPKSLTALAVVGTKRIIANEDVKSEHILNWLLYYLKALVKQVEGNTLRKSDIIGVKNDGQELYNEGEEEAKQLREDLAVEGRWLAMARRI